MSLLVELRNTYRSVLAAMEQRLGMGEAKLQIVRSLMHREPQTQAQLARELRLDPAAISRHLRDLEAKGLVSRSANPAHARQNRVGLTPAGHAFVAEARALRQDFEDRLLAGVPPEQTTALLQGLAALRERADRFTTHDGAKNEKDENADLLA